MQLHTLPADSSPDIAACIFTFTVIVMHFLVSSNTRCDGEQPRQLKGRNVTAAREQIVNDMKIDHHMRKDSGGQLGINADTLYGHGMKVWLEAKSAMDAGVYEAVLDVATKHCMQVLPWWRF
eukprot:221475-Chlamydomonas_euryale.AAC.2